MPRTVIVALDQSELSERALPVAVNLARQFGATLRLLSVLQVPAMYSEWIDELLAEDPWQSRYPDMIVYLERIAAAIDSVPVEIEGRVGLDAALEIDAVMSRQDDALLVLTTNGHSGIKRLVLGNIASRMMHIADYPLIIVPVEADASPETLSRILLPFDGSSFSEHALETTLALFGDSRPALHLLHVIDAVLGDNAADTAIRNRLHDKVTASLTRVADDLTARGYEVSWEIDEALHVPDRIAAVAQLADTQLIAMATHGRTGFSRFFLGSVADALVRCSTKPVLLIRPSEEVVTRAPESRVRALQPNSRA